MSINKLKLIILLSVFLLAIIVSSTPTAADENRITLSEGESVDLCDGNTLVLYLADPDTQQVWLSLQRDRVNIYECCLDKGESFEYPIYTHAVETSDGQYTYLGCMVSAKVESIKSVDGVTSVTLDPFHATDYELPEKPSECAPYKIIAEGETMDLGDGYMMNLILDFPNKVTIELSKDNAVIDSSTLGRGEYFSHSTEYGELSIRVDHINSVKSHESVTFSPFIYTRHEPVATPTQITPPTTTATVTHSQTSTPASAPSSTPTPAYQPEQTLADGHIEDNMEESFDQTPAEKGDSLPGFGIFASLSVLSIAVQILRRKKQ